MWFITEIDWITILNNGEGMHFSRNHPFPVFTDKLKTNTDFPDGVLSFSINCLQVVESFLGRHRKPGLELIKVSSDLDQIQVYLSFQAQSSLGCVFYLVSNNKRSSLKSYPAFSFCTARCVWAWGNVAGQEGVHSLCFTLEDPGRRARVAVNNLLCSAVIPGLGRSPRAGPGTAHSSILAWEIWTEKPGGLLSTESLGVRHTWARSHPGWRPPCSTKRTTPVEVGGQHLLLGPTHT